MLKRDLFPNVRTATECLESFVCLPVPFGLYRTGHELTEHTASSISYPLLSVDIILRLQYSQYLIGVDGAISVHVKSLKHA